MAKSKSQRRYTDKQKLAILSEAKRDGVHAAAKKHGVSDASIYTWKSRAYQAAAPTRYSAQKKIAILSYGERFGIKAAAEKHGVTESTIYSWRRRVKDGGNSKRKTNGVAKRKERSVSGGRKDRRVLIETALEKIESLGAQREEIDREIQAVRDSVWESIEGAQS